MVNASGPYEYGLTSGLMQANLRIGLLPSCSGIRSGAELFIEASRPNKVFRETSPHRAHKKAERSKFTVLVAVGMVYFAGRGR